MIRTLKRTATRADFIPRGATRIGHRHSDAVCYIYENASGQPCAMGFAGRRQKPDFRFRYTTTARREEAVRQYFTSCRERAEARKARQDKPRKLEVGHILDAIWGYDQTNVDFYQVTALVGDTMVELRKIAGNPTEFTAMDQGRTVPKADAFVGEPFRRRVRGDRVRIDDVRHASLWDGRPVAWTSYH